MPLPKKLLFGDEAFLLLSAQALTAVLPEAIKLPLNFGNGLDFSSHAPTWVKMRKGVIIK